MPRITITIKPTAAEYNATESIAEPDLEAVLAEHVRLALVEIGFVHKHADPRVDVSIDWRS